MTKVKLRRIFVAVVALYTAFVVGFYFLAGKQLKYRDSSNQMLDADSVSEEINNVTTVSQTFINGSDTLQSIELVFTKNYQEGSGLLTIQLLEGNAVLATKRINVEDVPEQHRLTLDINLKNMTGRQLTIMLSSTSEPGEGVRAMINKNQAPSGSKIVTNNSSSDGTLCFSLVGEEQILTTRLYWIIVGAIGLGLIYLLFISYKMYLNNRYNYIVNAVLAVNQYSFLISQLVIRDFKTKYKRSVFGVLWSFLNPLLTMTVQFLVFSTFFNADTDNYPVYLLIGVVCFSFFSECTSMCLTSISGNSTLITKVYIPKYIFPLSRTISSSVNLAISLVPLFLVCLVLGIAIKPQAILFFFFLACLIVFTLGVGLFLSAVMVFLRDTQFLWSVLIQIWNYATPIFYPAEIIPDKYQFIVKLNPLYHFIGNARTCLMNGVSPEPISYVYCLVFALGSLAIGSFVFKKAQDKFALYI